jgi:tetratricopeptide (TPR) repeat protein
MGKLLLTLVFVCLVSPAVPGQTPDPPVADTRLTVHTLLREDVFAGFLQGDQARLARAERNLEQLLASRQADRAPLLAWQGSTVLTRAVMALEAGRTVQFRQLYQRASDLFVEATRLGPEAVSVFAIIGGTQTAIADRLPAAERAVRWEQAYAAYQQLLKLQSSVLDTLPLHHQGEVLAGLAQSAQRTGRDAEADTHLDRLLATAPDSPYARAAQQWKANPATRAGTKLTCQTCHAPGMLVVRLAEVSKSNK